MNYRHGFHAGNFADCMKHALLVWIIGALQRKPAPIAVLDTHAGAGCYDLAAAAPGRTREAAQGIARLLADPPAGLDDYLSLVRAARERCGPAAYPGSPWLARALLRPDDRLICCERHPEEAAALRRLFARDPQVAVHHRDGWEALAALLPPTPRRGVVLIDPPFEAVDEFDRLVSGLLAARTRFPVGVLAAWYPVKRRAAVRDFQDRLRAAGLRDMVAAELMLADPVATPRLAGCGMLVINPPFRFEDAASTLLRTLCDRLGTGDPAAAVTVTRLADE